MDTLEDIFRQLKNQRQHGENNTPPEKIKKRPAHTMPFIDISKPNVGTDNHLDTASYTVITKIVLDCTRLHWMRKT